MNKIYVFFPPKKRAEKLIVFENLMGLKERIRSWVLFGGNSYHLPLFSKEYDKLTSLFKFNLAWLECVKLVKT
jgi:hypothetical protein